MSSYIEVMAIVEGKTEEIFIKNLVNPYLARKNIFMQATQISNRRVKSALDSFG